jgi:hypothetical protein
MENIEIINENAPVQIVETRIKPDGTTVKVTRCYRTEKVRLDMTQCRKCGKDKHPNEYNKNRRICKYCQNDYNVKLYHSKYKALNKEKKEKKQRTERKTEQPTEQPTEQN